MNGVVGKGYGVELGGDMDGDKVWLKGWLG